LQGRTDRKSKRIRYGIALRAPAREFHVWPTSRAQERPSYSFRLARPSPSPVRRLSCHPGADFAIILSALFRVGRTSVLDKFRFALLRASSNYVRREATPSWLDCFTSVNGRTMPFVANLTLARTEFCDSHIDAVNGLSKRLATQMNTMLNIQLQPREESKIFPVQISRRLLSLRLKS